MQNSLLLSTMHTGGPPSNTGGPRAGAVCRVWDLLKCLPHCSFVADSLHCSEGRVPAAHSLHDFVERCQVNQVRRVACNLCKPQTPTFQHTQLSQIQSSRFQHTLMLRPHTQKLSIEITQRAVGVEVLHEEREVARKKRQMRTGREQERR